MNLNHQLASRLVPAVLPWFVVAKTELALRLVLVITFHVSVSMSYRRPNSSYASILSIMSLSSAVEKFVVRLGITELIIAPFGIMLERVMGPTPVARFPSPPLAPSPSTAPTFAHALSSAFSVVDVTRDPLKNFRVSGDVNLTSAPGLTYFKFEVALSPTTRAPLESKYPVLVFVAVVVEFHVAVNDVKSCLAYFS